MKDFLFTLLAWLFTLPCIVGSIAFALYNAEVIPVTLNPFQNPIPLPMYVPVLGGIAFGFIFGAIMTWAAMGRLRKESRDQKKRIKELEKKVEVSPRTSAPTHNYALIPSSFLDK